MSEHDASGPYWARMFMEPPADEQRIRRAERAYRMSLWPHVRLARWVASVCRGAVWAFRCWWGRERVRETNAKWEEFRRSRQPAKLLTPDEERALRARLLAQFEGRR